MFPLQCEEDSFVSRLRKCITALTGALIQLYVPRGVIWSVYVFCIAEKIKEMHVFVIYIEII